MYPLSSLLDRRKRATSIFKVIVDVVSWVFAIAAAFLIGWLFNP